MRFVGVALAVALSTVVPGLWVGMQLDATPPLPPEHFFDRPSLTSTYEWSTRASISDFAFELRIRAVTASECRVDLAAAGITATTGPTYVKILRTEEGRAWSAMSADGLVRAHAEGLLDTRDLATQKEGDQWAMKASHRRPDITGNISLFFAVHHLAVWPGHEWTGDESLRFRLRCEQPFQVLGVWVAQQARAFNARSMDSGTVLHAHLVGTVVEQASQRVRMESPYARVVIGHFGNDGDLSVGTPKGVRAVGLAQAHTLLDFGEGGGEYEVRLDCVCRGTLWGVFADFRPVASLDQAFGATH